MALDDLLKGLRALRTGVTDFAVGSAVNDAREQINVLNEAELNREDNLNQLQAISQDLSLRLAQAGADPAQIQAIGQRIAPSPGAVFEAGERRALQERGFEQRIELAGVTEEAEIRAEEREPARREAILGGEEPFKIREEKRKTETGKDLLGFKRDIAREVATTAFERKKELEKLKLTAAEKKLEITKIKDTRKESLRQLDKFTSLKTTKETLDALLSGDRAINTIAAAGTSQVGVNLAINGLLKASGEQKISDADFRKAQQDPTTRRTIARRLKLEFTGEALIDERRFFTDMLKKLKQRTLEQLKKQSGGFAQSVKGLVDINVDDFQKRLLDRVGVREDVEEAVTPRQQVTPEQRQRASQFIE